MELPADTAIESLEQGTPRLVPLLVGLGALIASIAATTLLRAAGLEERAALQASRHASVTARDDTVSQAAGILLISTTDSILRLSDDVSARKGSHNVAGRAISMAERQAVLRLATVADEIENLGTSPILSSHLRDALVNEARNHGWDDRRAEEVNATRFAAMKGRALTSLTLAAIAVALLAVATTISLRRWRRAWLAIPTLLLVCSAFVAGLAWTT